MARSARVQSTEAIRRFRAKLIEFADNAKAAHERSLAWIKENLASMIGGATPVVTMGEVLAEVSAEAVA